MQLNISMAMLINADFTANLGRDGGDGGDGGGGGWLEIEPDVQWKRFVKSCNTIWFLMVCVLL